MLSFINNTEDSTSFRPVQVALSEDELKMDTVVKIWSVPPDHMFYILEGEESLFACGVHPSSVFKKSKIALTMPFRSLVCTRYGTVLVIFEDGSVRTLTFAREEGWTEGASFKLLSDPSSKVTYACSCPNNNLFWIQQSIESPLESCCSLWKCVVSPALAEPIPVRCLVQRLPLFRLYVLRQAAIVVPSLPSLLSIYLAFSELDCLKVCTLAAQTVLLCGTFQPPLDAIAFFKKRIRLWRHQVSKPCEVVDGCVSLLGNSVHLILRDGSVITLDSSGQFLQRVVLRDRDVAGRSCGCWSLGPLLCVTSDSLLQLHNLESGVLLQELRLDSACRGLLPTLWGFWTDSGVFRLAISGNPWPSNPPSQLQSEALLYAARHSRAQTAMSAPDQAQVKTKLNRILRPLVECYWKLQVTKTALSS